MNIVREFFFKNQGTFFQFWKKGRGDLSLSLPLASYAPDAGINFYYVNNKTIYKVSTLHANIYFARSHKAKWHVVLMVRSSASSTNVSNTSSGRIMASKPMIWNCFAEVFLRISISISEC